MNASRIAACVAFAISSAAVFAFYDPPQERPVAEQSYGPKRQHADPFSGKRYAVCPLSESTRPLGQYTDPFGSTSLVDPRYTDPFGRRYLNFFDQRYTDPLGLYASMFGQRGTNEIIMVYFGDPSVSADAVEYQIDIIFVPAQPGQLDEDDREPAASNKGYDFNKPGTPNGI